ncbi:hypothetical protein M8J75_006963 [Diaphorina citri]|nr:hypothetical protein M8J75_006963 [Diaphorina citri]
MECCCELEDIKDALLQLKAKDTIYIQNQELCQELGKQKERANYLDQVLQNAKLEIQNRDCLIEKVIKENEILENELKCQTENSPNIKLICRENENLKRELECARKAMKHLEEKYEWSVQCSQEKENFIESLEKNHAHVLEKMCCEIQQLRREKKQVEDLQEEDKEAICMLREEMSLLSEKYESMCKKLRERTMDLTNLACEYENYKRSVEVIKEYVMKNKVVPSERCQNKSQVLVKETCASSTPKREIQTATERWKQFKCTTNTDHCSKSSNEDEKKISDECKTNDCKITDCRTNDCRINECRTNDCKINECRINERSDTKIDCRTLSNPRKRMSSGTLGKTCCPPEPSKDGDNARSPCLRPQCSSESEICTKSVDLYEKYGIGQRDKCASMYKKYRNTKSTFASLNPCRSRKLGCKPSPYRGTVLLEKLCGKDKCRTTSKDIGTSQCNQFQELRMAYCPTIANQAPTIEWYDKSPEILKPRSYSSAERSKLGDHLSMSVTREEVETKVDTLYVSEKTTREDVCPQADNIGKSKTLVKDTKKKFKFF